MWRCHPVLKTILFLPCMLLDFQSHCSSLLWIFLTSLSESLSSLQNQMPVHWKQNYNRTNRKMGTFSDACAIINTGNFDNAAALQSFTLASHYFLNQHFLFYFMGPPNRHINAWHDGLRDEGQALPLPPSKVHMLLVWLKLPYFNVPTLEHEQDKFRVPSFWDLANKNPFIASMFLFTFF